MAHKLSPDCVIPATSVTGGSCRRWMELPYRRSKPITKTMATLPHRALCRLLLHSTQGRTREDRFICETGTRQWDPQASDHVYVTTTPRNGKWQAAEDRGSGTAPRNTRMYCTAAHLLKGCPSLRPRGVFRSPARSPTQSGRTKRHYSLFLRCSDQVIGPIFWVM